MSAELFSFSTPNPPLPTEEDTLAALCLIRSRRVGATTWLRLVGDQGSPAAALASLPQVAAAAGMADYTPCPEGVARAELRAGQKAGARLLIHGFADYPAALLDLADAPPVLWALGDTALLSRPMVALIGARNASSLGLRMARHLAAGLAEAGLVTIAGLARGIDTAVHESSIATGTIAVQAGGVDRIYPAENRALAEAIATKGLRLSEGPMGAEPQARHFPQRNRIISGLSRAVVVVEAAQQSGSLITARLGLDQGREVLAVPGHPFDGRAAGCNALIRDGATLIRGVDDVLTALGLPPREHPHAPGPDPLPPVEGRAPDHPHQRPGLRERVRGALNTPASTLAGQGLQRLAAAVRPAPAAAPALALHQRILDMLGPSPVQEDQLLRDLALPVADLSPALLELELSGDIRRAPGGMLSRAL